MKFSYWIFLHAHRVSLVALTSPPLAKQLLIVLFGRVENPLLEASWIIRVRIAFVFSLLIFVTLKLALNKAICSDGFRSLHSLHPTENPLLEFSFTLTEFRFLHFVQFAQSVRYSNFVRTENPLCKCLEGIFSIFLTYCFYSFHFCLNCVVFSIKLF